MIAEIGPLSPAAYLKSIHLEQFLLPVLIQLTVIVAAARLLGAIARKLRQPSAVGEIVAGLLLGPSGFQALAPQWHAMIFQPTFPGTPDQIALAQAAFSKIFVILSQLGLIFLLFLIGLEFDFGHLKVKGKAAVSISVTGILLPFALGAGLVPFIGPYLENSPITNAPVDRLGLTLFMGVAMSITAIPILGRIMIEMGIQRTKVAAVVITAAAVDDAAGWILLATVASLVRSSFDPKSTLLMLGLTLGFALAMIAIVRPIINRLLTESLDRNNGTISPNAFAAIVVVLLLAAIVTNLIGIFAIFGAFVLGATLSGNQRFRDAVRPRMSDFVNAFFLPIFFTYTGLKTNIGGLTGSMWLICAAVCAAAIIGKFGGCWLAARMGGFPNREAGIIGVMMNTRALMELIVVNAGYELGVIPPSLFTMLVIMAILTTIMTSPILLMLSRGTEIEEPLARSGF
jgi:Kef-type K+ transport system membrane component KefB